MTSAATTSLQTSPPLSRRRHFAIASSRTYRASSFGSPCFSVVVASAPMVARELAHEVVDEVEPALVQRARADELSRSC